MRMLAPTLALFVLSAWSCAEVPERNDLSITGKWRIENNTLHLQIENHGNSTILMEDPAGLVPSLIIAHGDFKGLPSLIVVDSQEDQKHFAERVLTNRAFWFSPMKRNHRKAIITWQIKLPPESVAQLNGSKASQLKLSGLEGAIVRDQDFVENAKTMLLTRFTTEVTFRHQAPREKKRSAEQGVEPDAGDAPK